MTTVTTGDIIKESGYYTIKSHTNPEEITSECKPLPEEYKRFFTKGIKASKMVMCGHSVVWSKIDSFILK